MSSFHGLNNDTTSRRTMLKRLGSAGLIATAGAGLFDILGAGSAHASTRAGIPVTGLPGQAVPANPDCCTTCNRNEGACGGGGHCPTGECCYHCDGCGLNGNYCLPYSCTYGHVQYCN